MLLVAACPVALAWIYPEHRDLAMLAVQGLDAERRAEFDRLWRDARSGHEARLCEAGADTTQGLAPQCIDWAALSAIAGDHSCSSAGMFETASESNWILQVADVAAQLKVDLAQLPVTARAEQSDSLTPQDLISDAQRRLADENVRAQRLNALRTADLRLQRADPQYATRAGSNNAHFLLARPSTDTGPTAYAELTLRPGVEVSAVGVYAYFHLSALQKASRLADEPTLTPQQRRLLARAALADEAFALHFLEDVFAAGHIAGTWGSASQRQGTHDYYNQNGLEVFTWRGGSKSVVLMGDAHMRPQDAQIASATVRKSLEQVIDVASGRGEGRSFPDTPAAPEAPDTFDVCHNNTIPERGPGLQAQLAVVRPFFQATLLDTPVPSLGPGLGSMPRSRSEVGVFVGLAGSIDARHINGGFASGQDSGGYMGGLDLSFRAGFGLDGVMNQAGDGLVYASIGLRTDTASTNKFADDTRGVFTGNNSAAIPARAGLSTRIRMPFYLIPGDLLLAAPLLLFNREAYANMAVTAGNGGLIPWQSGLATPIGHFQMVLGRELGVTFYRRGNDQLIAPATTPGSTATVVDFKSTRYDLPIAEYRPYRAFSTNQSSSVVFQLFAAYDKPGGAQATFPAGAPTPQLHPVRSYGLRLVFDWRYYR
jgi:hypothetical protein